MVTESTLAESMANHSTVVGYLVFLVVIAIQRLMELRISNRNSRWALECGGSETGREHFVVMKLLHTAFLIACAAEVVLLERSFVLPIAIPMLAIAVLTQGIRWWTMRSLGRYWNARVITVPDMQPVRDGPYRWMRHPNYLAVVLEGVAIPMLHGAWITALLFTLANGCLLRVRIRHEEAALESCSDYAAQMSQLGALWPRWRRGRDRDCDGEALAPSATPSSWGS